jgi:hypothetical protein
MCLGVGGGGKDQKGKKPKGKQMDAGTALVSFINDISAAKSGNKPSKGYETRSYGKGDTMDLGPGAIYAFDTGGGGGGNDDKGGSNHANKGPLLSPPPRPPHPEQTPSPETPSPPPETTPPPPAQAPLTDAWLEALRRNQTTYGPIGSVLANPALASGNGSGTVYR